MSIEHDLAALRAGDAWVDRSDRGFVVVRGADTFSFLQALVSADLDPVADGDAVHSLLLSPQGKLDVDFRLVRVGDDAWLDCDPGLGAQLTASLNRFKIRVDAEMIDRTGDFGMLTRVGPAHEATPDVPDGVRVVRTRWGHDLVGPRDRLPAHDVVDPVAFDAWRIEQGIPVQPRDVDETTIPQEAFLEVDAVSFTKGCFLGQELVCRIDTRGHVNRFLRRFTEIEGDWPVAGAEVVVGAKVVGALTSVAADALRTGALGYVRREVEPPAAVELRWDGGTARAVLADALS
jgi:folate-binding protein YgfZ